MTDVPARLRALAQDVAAQHEHGPGLPVERMVARARARRAARTTWTVGAAAAVTVAVALGAGALDRPTRGPLPAGSPTATATALPAPTTPAPTQTPPTLPVGDASLPFGACASVVGAAPAHPADDTLVLEHDDLPPTLAAGEPLPVAVSLGAGRTLVRPSAGPRVVVTRDGVVVTTTDAYGGLLTDWEDQSGWVNVARHVADVPLTVCEAPGASVGAPLPSGTYDVWFVGTGALTDDSLDEADVAALSDPDAGLLRSITAGPFPLTVEGTADSVRTPPTLAPGTAPYPGMPVAEGPAPDAPTTTGTWRFTHSTDALTVPAEELVAAPDGLLDAPGVDVTGTLTHVGPGRSTLHLDLTVVHWFVQDGRVVGTTYQPGDGTSGVVDLGPGHGTTLVSSSRPPATCPRPAPGDWCMAEGEALPPGEYTLVPGVVVYGGALWTPGTGAQPLEDVLTVDGAGGDPGAFVVLGAPIPLTVS